MLSLKICLWACVIIVGSFAKSVKILDPPQWPDAYKVTGFLRLPYAELNEPFTAYYDGKSNRSRIDFYGDAVQTFQLGSYSTAGAQFKIEYMSFNDSYYNVKTCFQINGSADNPTSPQNILPDLTGFQLLSSPGDDLDVWYKVETKGQKVNKYTMTVRRSDQSPVRYEMYGYDSLLGSHFDKYYVDYENFVVGLDDYSVFIVPNNNTCGGFPGPGSAANRILFNPMREFIHHDDTHHAEEFEKYKKKHNKNYDSDLEHTVREANFRHNVRFIHSKNRSPITYSLAINHLTDRSREELKLMNGRRASKGYNGGKAFDKNKYKNAAPDSFDWRLYGAVTPVKDQAVCGSCWSFGTTGTIEGAYFLATGSLVRFSQQELMDCSWGFGNNGCDGGEDFRAYQWIMQSGGLASEDDYGSYKGQDLMCLSKNTSATVKLAGFVNVTSGDQEALKMAIFANGPISVAIDASHLSLSFYANGVYYEEQCRSDPDGLDHAVLAVGYGAMKGQEYWLIKNSWSTYWGNDGYVLMSKYKNNCGVATAPTFVEIAK